MEPELTNGEKLMNILLPLAEKQLRKSHSFHPLAVTMNKNGEIDMDMAYAGKIKVTIFGLPVAQEEINLITTAHQKEAREGNLLASAICFDSRMKNEEGKIMDAICISIEEKEGKSINLFEPYKRSFLGKVTFYELSASAKDKVIFN